MEDHQGLGHILVSAGVTFAALFPIADPIGNVPTYLSLVHDRTRDERRIQARKAALAMVAILVTTLLIGRFVLSFFGISLGALSVVGGLVVGYMGWMMISGPLPGSDQPSHGFGEDIYFTPLAMPMLAGPGAIGVVLGLGSRSDEWVDYIGIVIGILLISILTYAVLLGAERILRVLGPKGVDVMNRVMGVIVMAIAVELVFHGIADHFNLTSTD